LEACLRTRARLQRRPTPDARLAADSDDSDSDSDDPSPSVLLHALPLRTSMFVAPANTGVCCPCKHRCSLPLQTWSSPNREAKGTRYLGKLPFHFRRRAKIMTSAARARGRATWISSRARTQPSQSVAATLGLQQSAVEASRERAPGLPGRPESKKPPGHPRAAPPGEAVPGLRWRLFWRGRCAGLSSRWRCPTLDGVSGLSLPSRGDARAQPLHRVLVGLTSRRRERAGRVNWIERQPSAVAPDNPDPCREVR
jgi:hypothetical protein